MSQKLSSQQEEYKNLRISGLEPLEAYRAAYPKSKGSAKTQSNEAHRLDKHPVISPMIESARKEVAERALVTTEDVVKGLLLEAQTNGEGSSQGARVSAWKELSNYTGGFDKNKQQVEQKTIEMTQEEWLTSLK